MTKVRKNNLQKKRVGGKLTKYIGTINIEIQANSEDPGPRPRFRKNAEPNNGNTLAIDDLHPKKIITREVRRISKKDIPEEIITR